MHRFHCLFVIVLFIGFVFSSPLQRQKRSFKVKRIPNPNYVPNGRRAYYQALGKYGINDISPLPGSDVALRLKGATLAVLDEGDENGKVNASPTQNDVEFLSPVSVGGQTLNMVFDSGSSDTWVFNTNLNAASQRGHTIYDPTKSSVAKTLTGATFNISYGDGSAASGPVVLDQVDIGGSTVQQQAVGVPNALSQTFVQDTLVNGLVGLAFSTLNTVRPQRQKTFFDNVLPDLTLPVFTAQLKHGQAGSYEFGNIDDTAFTGTLATIPVDNSQGFWEVASELAIAGNTTVNIKNGRAIVDTGTSLILTTNSVVSAYWSQVANAQFNVAQGGVIFPCNSVLPDLQLQLGGSYMALVPGSGLNFAKAGVDQTTGTTFCFGGLQSVGNAGFSIYGDVFFKSQFVVFSADGPSLGLAPNA